jgi:DNA-binding MarR family transcriptional regulator
MILESMQLQGVVEADELAVDGFLEAFDSLATAIRRARGSAAAGSGHPLSLSQYGLLQPLTTQPHARIGELAEAAGITASTATRILDALERRGLVARRRPASDRRAVSVTLTAQGRAILGAQDQWIQARQREFYATLSAGERELAPDLLRKLAVLIDVMANSFSEA